VARIPASGAALLVAFLIIGGLAGVPRATAAPPATPIRFGLTAVVVDDNLRFLNQWADYLSARMDRPVKFIRRRTYREIMELLKSGRLEFAWICGFPFVQKREPEFIKLMAVPIYRGEPLYHSYIIVNKDSTAQTFEDLEGKVFAFSDPDSNSGYLYPQYLLVNKSSIPDRYFRQTFFTFSHADTVEAVAERVADGGAVDSYIWNYLNASRPDITARTRIIKVSPAFGFPPLVANVNVDEAIVDRMKAVFLEMAENSRGRGFLNGLKLDGFGDYAASLFDNIREMNLHTRKARPWLDAVKEQATEMAGGAE